MAQNDLSVVAGAKFLSKRTELIRLQYDVIFNGVNCIAHQLSLPVSTPDADSAKFNEECKRLSRLRHPNILQHLGVHYDTSGHHYVLTEALYTTLDVYLASGTYGPTSVEVSILRDVSRGLQYLRSQTPAIVHRELIAQNIHLSFDMRAKIAIVGVSLPCDVTQITNADIAVYMPPEASLSNSTSPSDTKRSTFSLGFSGTAVCQSPGPLHDTKWDIYSFGVLLAYTALHKLPPFKTPLIEWMNMNRVGRSHPLHTLACKCLSDSPEDRLPIDDLSHEMDTVCEKHSLKIIDILEVVQRSNHVDVQQRGIESQTGSSSSGWFGTLSSAFSAASNKVITAVIGDPKNDDSTSVDKDTHQIICQPTMVGEEEWIKTDLLSKVLTLEDQLKLKDSQVLALEDQLKLKDSQIAVYKEDFANERNDRTKSKASLDKCKEELQNKEQQLAEIEMTVKELQSMLDCKLAAHHVTDNQVKELHDYFKKQLQYKETELANAQSECQSVNGKLFSMEEATMLNKTLQTLELARVQAELEAAKEEIAVKVAQVKQYQKQVEGYKQSTSNSFKVHSKNEFEQLYHEEKERNAHLMEEIDTLKETLAQATLTSSSRERPRQTAQESSASKATSDSNHSHIFHSIDYGVPPPIMLPKAYHTDGRLLQDSRPIACPVEASKHHRVETDGMTDIPFDPNLVCPICRRNFRKGEIQLYRQHVDLCAK